MFGDLVTNAFTLNPRHLLTSGLASRRIVWWALLIIISLAGAVLRLHRIDAVSLSLDEIGEVMVAGLRLTEPLLSGVRAQAGAAPLDYLGIKITMTILGGTTDAVRLWPWLLGSLGVPVIAWTAWETFRSREVAIVAAALLAIAAFDVYYSREVRFYALSVLLSLTVLAVFAGAVRRRSAVWWSAFGCALVTGLYAHYFIAFVALACGVGFLVSGVIDVATAEDRKAAVRRLVPPATGLAIATGLAVVAFLPWYFYAAAPQLGQPAGGSLQALSLEEMDRIMSTVLFPAASSDPHILGTLFIRSVQLLAVVGLAAAWSTSRPTALALALLAVGIVPAVWAADSSAGYFFHVRQVIVLVGCLNLLAAAGMVWIMQRVCEFHGSAGRLARPAVALVFISAIVVGSMPLRQVYSGSFGTKEDWRGAASLLVDQVCDDARIYVNVGAAYKYGVGYYAPELEHRARFVTVATDRAIPDVMRDIDLTSRDWVVTLVYAPGVGGSQSIEQLVKDLTQRGFELRKFTFLLLVFVPPQTCLQ